MVKAERRRAAMMSVYYHALGRQLELRGAPAVLLPPAVRPMPLEAALEVIEEVKRFRSDTLREVLWTLLRTATPPPHRDAAATRDARYSSTVQAFAKRACGDEDFVQRYDDTRAEYRRRATLFAAALVEYARERTDTFDALRGAYARLGDFVAADGHDAPLIPSAYLDDLARERGRNRAKRADELRRLEDQVGMSLPGFANDLADATAFMELYPTDPDEPFVAYPTAAVVVQDSPSLTVRVTATSLVRATDLQEITTTLDPRNWEKWSDCFRRVRYVQEKGRSFSSISKRDLPPPGGEYAGLVEEKVAIMSGESPTEVATFHNLLDVQLTPGPDDAELTFSLHRSIDSRYMWDSRPGGILVDEGFTKVKPVFPPANGEARAANDPKNVWRVTVRKTLRFADRTPASWGDTPLQFGQSLNYLAPAAISWWLQSDIYNAARFAMKRRGR